MIIMFSCVQTFCRFAVISAFLLTINGEALWTFPYLAQVIGHQRTGWARPVWAEYDTNVYNPSYQIDPREQYPVDGAVAINQLWRQGVGVDGSSLEQNSDLSLADQGSVSKVIQEPQGPPQGKQFQQKAQNIKTKYFNRAKNRLG